MYAVIKSGGKQHRVEPGEVKKKEKLEKRKEKSWEERKILLFET